MQKGRRNHPQLARYDESHALCVFGITHCSTRGVHLFFRSYCDGGFLVRDAHSHDPVLQIPFGNVIKDMQGSTMGEIITVNSRMHLRDETGQVRGIILDTAESPRVIARIWLLDHPLPLSAVGSNLTDRSADIVVEYFGKSVALIKTHGQALAEIQLTSGSLHRKEKYHLQILPNVDTILMVMVVLGVHTIRSQTPSGRI